jgi:N-methylhydantoinase A
VAGLPIRVPMFNIHTIGAGGGSIAWFDSAGVLHVGPRSAGADPGPICYGKGDEPTVTDCNLLLGRLPALGKLAGTKSLDFERTERLTREWLRRQKQELTLEQFAEGVIRVVNSNMEKAVRLISIEKGHDPRQFTLVSFGGAGALHACELAEELEVPQVLVPFMPGALSAFGILLSDVVKDFSRTLMLPASENAWHSKTRNTILQLRRQAAEEFKAEGWHGKVEFSDRLDVRYVGQGYEISVPFSRESLQAFRAEHHRLYGFAYDKPVEVVNVRVTARIPTRQSKWRLPKESGKAQPEKLRMRHAGKPVLGTCLDRAAIRTLRGPALITEYSATTFIPPGWSARADSRGNLLLEKIEGSR